MNLTEFHTDHGTTVYLDPAQIDMYNRMHHPGHPVREVDVCGWLPAYTPAYCGNPHPCPIHAHLTCDCGNPATTECAYASSFVCGRPVCGNPHRSCPTHTTGY